MLKEKSKVVKKIPCPKCREEGRDTKGDNLALYDDGHKYCFACTYTEFSDGQTITLSDLKTEFEMSGTSGAIRDRRISSAITSNFGVTGEYN